MRNLPSPRLGSTFVRISNPQPARVLCGNDGKSAATSGRDPRTRTASPMRTRSGPSPATGSRSTRTLVTAMSSSAQPVTASDPLMPVVLSTGVSNTPNGAPGSVTTESATCTVCVPLAAAAAATVRVATLPFGGSVARLSYDTLTVAGPVPLVGETAIQGLSDVTVQLSGLP